jgi:S-adenosylmethionine decarboxylase
LNLVTHSLGVNFYLMAPPQSRSDILSWAKKIDQQYSETELEAILHNLSDALGTQTMSFSSVNYNPHGASANLLIAQHVSALAHLDASHISTHTYFDLGDTQCWSTFRLELEISSCGDIHPADCLGDLFKSMVPDLGTIDTRSRGINRNTDGELRLAVDEFQLEQLDPDGYVVRKAQNGAVVFVSNDIGSELNHVITSLLAPQI